jgi:hypothetical protein
MNDDLPETVEKCLKILEENVEVLTNLEMDLEEENKDELVPNLEIHQLFDMIEDVSHSSKIKRAEFNLARRETEESM